MHFILEFGLRIKVGKNREVTNKYEYKETRNDKLKAAVMYTIRYNGVQICNKKKFCKTVYKIPIVLHRNVYSVQRTLCLYTLWSKNAGSHGSTIIFKLS